MGSEPDVSAVIRGTGILQTIQQMLSFHSMEEEVYYLKLEALWILTNLAVTDTVSSMCLLASDLD